MAPSQTEIAKGGANEAAADMTRDESNAHILEAAYSIAQIHAEHHRSATPHERTMDRTTGIFGQPWFILLLTVVIAGWQAGNFGAPYFGVPPIDPLPILMAIFSPSAWKRRLTRQPLQSVKKKWEEFTQFPIS